VRGRPDREDEAMKIKGDALELAFRIVLSCPCAVTHGEEQAVFSYLKGLDVGEVADYAPVLAAFSGEDTPFHGLAAFTEWMAPDPSDPTIERHHVLRCNGSGYHWRLAAETLPEKSQQVSSISRYLLSHMVLPAELTTGPDGTPQAVHHYEGGSVLFENIFLPPEYRAGASDLWAIHLGAVVNPLSPDEAQLVRRLGEANGQLVRHRRQVERVDYADFEFLGDWRAFCEARHAPFYAGVAG
jgi:hypothetical protein